MTTISQALLQARQQLSSSVDNPHNEALLLLAHSSGKRKEFLLAHTEDALDSSTYQHFQSTVTRRHAGEPLAYITRNKEFWSLPLTVQPGVLIPRPDSELLVEATLEIARQHNAVNILDLGTGSGCIALALASELPHAHITACDNSSDCVELAQQNARALKLDNINIILSHWFNDVTPDNFDIIVSNPPYISPQDKQVELAVAHYEPATALYADNNGLADLHHIIQQAPRHLTACGWLLLEHGYQQAQAVSSAMNTHQYCNIQTLKDLQQHDRVTRARRQT